MTKNAENILNIINSPSTPSHLTAEQIYLILKEQNQKTALATVYNNLSLLYNQGLIRKMSVEGYPDRYDNIKRHDHLVCKKCGKMSDIALDDFTGQIQKQIGIPIISYDLKVNYICDECLKSNIPG